MCLTDNSFRNLPTGDVVDQFIGEFSRAVVTATTDVNGVYETKLIHGDYEVTFKDADPYKFEKYTKSQGISHHFKVEASTAAEDIFHFQF